MYVVGSVFVDSRRMESRTEAYFVLFSDFI